MPYKYLFSEQAAGNITTAIISILLQSIFLYITRKKNKFYVKFKNFTQMCYYGINIIGNVAIFLLFSIKFGSTDGQEQAKFQIYRYVIVAFTQKSLPAAFFVLTCAISYSMLFNQKIRKMVLIIITCFVSVLVITTIVLSITIMISLQNLSYVTIERAFDNTIALDTVITVASLIFVLIFYITLYMKKKDYLLMENLQKIYLLMTYEISVFVGFLIFSLIYNTADFFMSFTLQGYLPLYVIDRIFFVFFSFMSGMVFIPSKRSEKKIQQQEIELINNTNNIDFDNEEYSF